MVKTNKDAKAASKKEQTPRITKAQAKKFLGRVPEQNAFWCADGCIFRDIGELRDALAGMSDQTFGYHCNLQKKDFSNWIREVVGDVKLAQALETVPNREHAARILEERCNLLIGKAR